MADAPKPYGDVKYADPKNGKYPVDTKEHAKAAWSYINMPKNAAMYPMNGVSLGEVKDRIKAACKEFGIQVDGEPDADDTPSSRTESLMHYYRSFPLEDISIRAGDGRTVDAYAAVFNHPAPVNDQDGKYMEELDPAVFNKAIADAAPQGGRSSWRTGVFYNHGMTIWGTPSDLHSMPIGVPLEIRTDSKGLFTRTRYHKGDLCDEILDRIREGSLPGYSFTGIFKRSTPLIPRGGFRPNYRTGELPHVRRVESTLREYGPTPFPVYADAAVTGMRAALASDPDLALRMFSMFRDGTPLEPPEQPGTPCDEEPPPGSRTEVHSGRSVKEQIAANRAELLQRQHRS